MDKCIDCRHWKRIVGTVGECRLNPYKYVHGWDGCEKWEWKGRMEKAKEASR